MLASFLLGSMGRPADHGHTVLPTSDDGKTKSTTVWAVSRTMPLAGQRYERYCWAERVCGVLFASLGHFAGAGSLLQLTLVSLHAFIGSQFLRQHQAFLARSARSLIPISPVPFPLQRRKNQRENLANFSRKKSTAMAMSASGEAPTSRSMVRKPSKPAACNAGR